jgi:hypothetical protein
MLDSVTYMREANISVKPEVAGAAATPGILKRLVMP